MSSSEGLVVTDLSVRWRDRPVLDRVGLRIAAGEFVTLMGPNGAGKTTLLRALAGFEPIESGEVLLDGRSLRGVPPHRRGLGLLFQDPVLLPRKTVFENVAFGPEVQGAPPAEVERRTLDALSLLRIAPLADRSAVALSGGERQRVALARTLAARPRVVLLDEPFASVDVELRSELRAEFRRVLSRQGLSVLHVTHDRDEGLFLGDRVLLMFGGRVEREGPPAELLQDPRTEATARFLGFNIVRTGEGLRAVRPEQLQLVAPSEGRFPVLLEASGRASEGYLVYASDRSGGRYEIRTPTAPPPVGSEVGLRWTDERPLEGS